MSADAHERFLKLHMKHQQTLFSYLLGQVRNPHQAEDILQEVSIICWRKFASYDQDRPYLPWAIGVARNEVRRSFRKLGRQEGLLPQDVLDQVAETMVKEDEALTEEFRFLESCVSCLNDWQRKLLFLRYQDGCSPRDMAVKLGRPLSALNMQMVRLRKSLARCIEQKRAQARHV